MFDWWLPTVLNRVPRFDLSEIRKGNSPDTMRGKPNKHFPWIEWSSNSKNFYHSKSLKSLKFPKLPDRGFSSRENKSTANHWSQTKMTVAMGSQIPKGVNVYKNLVNFKFSQKKKKVSYPTFHTYWPFKLLPHSRATLWASAGEWGGTRSQSLDDEFWSLFSI